MKDLVLAKCHWILMISSDEGKNAVILFLGEFKKNVLQAAKKKKEKKNPIYTLVNVRLSLLRQYDNPFVGSSECHNWDSVINSNIYVLHLLDELRCSLECLRCPRRSASSYHRVRLWR